MSTSAFKFKTDPSLPATFHLGPGMQVRIRESDELLGWVRRIEEPVTRGDNWMVFDASGREIAISDFRTTAANLLHRRWHHTPPTEALATTTESEESGA